MASIGHIATGALIGAVYARATRTPALPAMTGFAALALAPDLDLFTMKHVSRDSALDHRVLTHAVVPSLVIGGLLGGLVASRARWLGALLGGLAWASHGVLDAFTRHGPGPTLLWPFDTTRHAFAWQPVPGAPSWQIYFSWDVVPILTLETLMFLPVLALAAALAWGWRPKTVAIRHGDTGEMAASETG